MREIFGDPFRPVTLNPVWVTSNVQALAEQIFSGRTFDLGVTGRPLPSNRKT